MILQIRKQGRDRIRVRFTVDSGPIGMASIAFKIILGQTSQSNELQ